MEQLENQIFVFTGEGTRLGEHSRVLRQLQMTKPLSATKPRTLLEVGLAPLGKSLWLG